MEEVDISFNIMKKVHGAKRERNHDKYGRSTKLLEELSGKLEDLNIHTSPSLLFDLSELSCKYHLIFDKGPRVLVEQEIVVPEYTYGGLVTNEVIRVKSLLPTRHHVLSKRHHKNINCNSN